MGSCGGCGESAVYWNGGEYAEWNGVFGEKVWLAGVGAFVGSADLCVFPAMTHLSDDDL